ncbi:MAG: LamG domain-containing protein, partial [Armatimonadota bacterium]
MTRWQIVASALAMMAAVPLLLPGASALAAGGDGSVAQWTFNGQYRRLSRDVAANKYHAVAGDDYAHVESPGLQALVFDGVDDFLRVSDDPDLVMTDAVTLDLWVMLDSAEGGPQCLVDKGGERYRLQVSGSSALFGLKSGAERMDLTGGELVAGQWHRITGVFDRPAATLYVDGEQVGSATWDHEIGPGGDLFIGSKSGGRYFFDGQIDELRIYDHARPPQAEDAPSTDPVGAGGMIDAKLDVRELTDGVRVDTGAAVFELTDDGGLRALTIGGQAVMADNEQPLLAASALESAEYDGWRDYAPGEVVEATWRPDEHRYDANDEEFSAGYTGTLDFGDGDTIGCQILLETKPGSPFLTATVSLTPHGDFEDRFIRDISLRLPLSLDRRKRVVQAGDRGIQWNTRHFYQFHVGPTQRLLNEPDHNIWRRFAID